MQAPQDNLTHTLGKRLIYRDLPLVGAAAILFWLEGSPPTAWIQLVYISAQWNAAGAQHEALLLPLCLLIAQSVLLIVAWGIFFWAVYHEVIALINIYTLPQHKPQTVKLSQIPASQTTAPNVPTRKPTRIPPSSSSARKASQPKFFMFAGPKLSIQPASTPVEQEPSFPPITPAPPVEFPSNPFEERIEQPTSITALEPTPSHALTPTEPPMPPVLADEVRQESLIEDASASTTIEIVTKGVLPTPFEDSEEAPPNAPAKSSKKKVVEALDEKQQSKVLNDLGFYRSEKLDAPKAEQQPAEDADASHQLDIEPILATRAPEHIDASETNPFDVQSDLIDLFQFDGAIEEETEDADSDEEETDSTYVFGNPFEGPLPDVFQHDEDLKRMLRTQTQQDDPKSGKRPSRN